MSGNGVLEFPVSLQYMLVSCKCNHFCLPPFLFVFLLSAPHVVLDSETPSAGRTSLAFFLLHLRPGTLVRGEQGVFL